MKRNLPLVLLSMLILPTALMAQPVRTPQAREAQLLKQLGLDEGRISQVQAIQSKTQSTIRDDAVRLRLVRAQIAEAMLPAKPDMTKVNTLVDQSTAIRGDIEKAMLSAQAQIRSIMGANTYQEYRQMQLSRRGRYPRVGSFIRPYDPGPVGRANNLNVQPSRH